MSLSHLNRRNSESLYLHLLTHHLSLEHPNRLPLFLLMTLLGWIGCRSFGCHQGRLPLETADHRYLAHLTHLCLRWCQIDCAPAVRFQMSLHLSHLTVRLMFCLNYHLENRFFAILKTQALEAGLFQSAI